MRMKTWLIAAIFLTCPMLAGAQDWSAEQQAVIDVGARCNDGWTESHRQQDYALFADACPQTPDAVYWYTGNPTPITYGGDDGLWAASAATGNLPLWSNLVPRTVQVGRALALIYFEVLWTVHTPDGRARRNPSRRLLVMRRGDGGWQLAGGTIAGIPTPP